MTELKGVEIWYGEELKPLLGSIGGHSSPLCDLVEELRAQLAARYQVELMPVTVYPDTSLPARRVEVLVDVQRKTTAGGLLAYASHSYHPNWVDEERIGGRKILTLDLSLSLNSDRILTIIRESVRTTILEEAAVRNISRGAVNGDSTFVIEA